MRKSPRISRAKFENIAYLTLNVLNMTTYAMAMVASIMKGKEGTIAEIIQAIYCTIMSVLLILHEFTSPAWILNYFGFLYVHRGKGILMLFLGCLVMCEIAFNIIVAIIAFTIGFAYIILSLIPGLPPPNSFLLHWQNHRDFWAEGLDLSMPTLPVTTVPLQPLQPPVWQNPPFKIPIDQQHYYHQQHVCVY